MNVAYVLPQGKGGIAHYTAELANAVSESAEVTVLKPTTSSADGLFDDDVRVLETFEPLDISNAGIHRGDLNIVRNLKAARSFTNVSRLDEVDPDVVHFTAPASLLPQTQLFVRLHGIDRRFPLVETYHDVYPRKILRRGVELDAEEPLFNVVTMNAMQAVDALVPNIRRAHCIAHTQAGRETLIRRGENPKNVSVVPHGTYDFFTEYDHVNVEEERNRLLYFGNLVPTKAPDTAIEAVPLVAEEREDATMIIAGEGSIPDSSWDVIRRNPDLFEVHNSYVPEAKVGEYFRRAQVVVIPHRRQYGHSGTLTIAFAYRTPVVTSDVGDFPRLVEESGCGETAPKNDPRRFADAILSVLENDDARTEMRANAARMARRFSWDKVAARHLEIYEDASGARVSSQSPSAATQD